jgi:hypothetical protein
MDALPTLVAVDDCDDVDGVILERNVGEKDYSKAQWEILFYRSAVELRVQVSPTRYRVPGICVVLGLEPDEQVFTSPPLFCALRFYSLEDRMSRMQQRIDDYVSGIRSALCLGGGPPVYGSCQSDSGSRIVPLSYKDPSKR